jgi:hypothetical protein
MRVVPGTRLSSFGRRSTVDPKIDCSQRWLRRGVTGRRAWEPLRAPRSPREVICCGMVRLAETGSCPNGVGFAGADPWGAVETALRCLLLEEGMSFDPGVSARCGWPGGRPRPLCGATLPPQIRWRWRQGLFRRRTKVRSETAPGWTTWNRSAVRGGSPGGDFVPTPS